MKSILGSLFLLFSLSLSAQQGVIGYALAEQMSISNDATIRINVFLKEKLDVNAIHLRFTSEQMPLPERPKFMMQALKQHATYTQAGLIEKIKRWNEQHQQQATLVKAHWIVNMLIVDAPKELIHLLSGEESIELIEWDEALKLEFYLPIKSESANPKSVNGSEPGLQAIKAPYLWQMGYTGRNTRAYSVDTGIWENHPAIRENFLSTFFPYSITWNAFDQPTPADKVNSHGTHTMGTVCGLDRSTNDTIGVAFNARFVATDPIVSDISMIKPLSVIMSSYEWALNPDGDELTTDDIPHVIVNSWGISGSFDPDLCVQSYVHDLFSACNAAGIAIVFSAGNNGPNAQTIGKPAYVVVNDVVPFTVGALNASNLTIANFSSRGPIPCDIGPDLRIKPEVAAPGVNVRSAVGQNEYDSYSGTSMAGPHVAGAYLLLKEAFPDLHPEGILRVLLHTAIDLGEPGNDNTYGMGMIDLQAAFDSLSTLHSPIEPNYNGYDLRIDEVRIPGLQNRLVCSSETNVEFRVSNSGDFEFTGFSILAKNQNEQQVAFDYIDVNLQPGQQWQGSLNIPTIQGFNEWQFTASLLIDIVEVDHVNNNRMLRFHRATSTSIPFFEPFENHAIKNSDWIILNPDFGRTWDTLRTAGLNFGQYSARMDFRNYNPRNFQRDELITPLFQPDNSNDSLYLKFNYAYRFIHQTFNDSLHVSLLRNCGQQRISLIRMGGQIMNTVVQSINNFVPATSEHWREIKINLSDILQQNAIASNEDLLISFTSLNRGGSLLYLDNVAIYRGNDDPTAVNEVNQALEWEIYPNPVGESSVHIKLSSPFRQTVKIEVVDLMGKVWFNEILPANSQQHSLSLDKLSSGLYFIRLSNQNIITVKRLVKK
ncbi:MAG: S8 family serine peptidase [Flavobacteriales bacterium]